MLKLTVFIGYSKFLFVWCLTQKKTQHSLVITLYTLWISCTCNELICDSLRHFHFSKLIIIKIQGIICWNSRLRNSLILKQKICAFWHSLLIFSIDSHLFFSYINHDVHHVGGCVWWSFSAHNLRKFTKKAPDKLSIVLFYGKDWEHKYSNNIV